MNAAWWAWSQDMQNVSNHQPLKNQRVTRMDCENDPCDIDCDEHSLDIGHFCHCSLVPLWIVIVSKKKAQVVLESSSHFVAFWRGHDTNRNGLTKLVGGSNHLNKHHSSSFSYEPPSLSLTIILAIIDWGGHRPSERSPDSAFLANHYLHDSPLSTIIIAAINHYNPSIRPWSITVIIINQHSSHCG